MRKFSKLFILIFCFYTFTTLHSFGQDYADLQKISLAEDLKTIPITDSNKKIIDIGAPCSLTDIGEYFIIVNYEEMFLLNKETGEAKLLAKPNNIDVWVPTGVKWAPKSKILYLANYNGHDVLLLRFNDQLELELIKRISDSEMISPENVDILEDEQLLAIADYDASKIFLFKNNKKLWSIDVPLAHDVAFNRNEKTLFALGLGPPMVYKLNYGGKLLSKKGEIGWGKNGYLWPTGVSIKNNNIAISDAHTGKITFISQALLPAREMGGNGVGVDLFNMPYGIEIHDDKLLYITDTFKGRILEVNYKKSNITKIYQGNRLIIDVKAYAKAKHKRHKNMVTNKSPEGFVRNETSNKRLDKNQILKIKFAHLPKSMQTLKWHPTYNGLLNADTGKELHLQNSYIYAYYPYFFVYGKNYKLKEMNFLILGSPTTETWLVIHEGVMCPVEIGMDYWIDNKSLLSSNGDHVPFRRIAKVAREKILNYKNEVKKGTLPDKAITKHLLGTERYQLNLRLSLNSETGKKMFDQLKQTTTAAEQGQVAKDYINSLEDSDPLFLVEIAFANTIIEGYDVSPKGYVLKLYRKALKSKSLDRYTKYIQQNIINNSIYLVKCAIPPNPSP